MKNPTSRASDFRLKARELFESLSWPGPDLESWRRSSAKKIPFDRYRPYPHETVPEGSLPVENAAEPPSGFSGRIIFEGGEIKEALFTEGFKLTGSEPVSLREKRIGEDAERILLKSAEAAEDRVQAWQLAELTHGLALRVPDGVVLPGPLLVEFRESGVDLCAAPHIAISLGDGSEAEIIVGVRTREGARILINFGASLEAGQNGHLNFTLDQDIGIESRFFSTVHASLERDATLDLSEFHLGGLFVKTHSRVNCTAPGASSRLFGAYTAAWNTHKDIGIVQGHRSTRGTSKALYKGVVASGGRSVFQGLITVDEGAEKTDAYLANKNLLLGSGARADSIPKLVIGNNDVRCTHGSTTGRIDPLQLFYLTSRGLPEPEAKKLILAGFLEEAISAVPASYRSDLENRFSEAVSRLVTQGEG